MRTENNKLIAEFMGLELEETLLGVYVYARKEQSHIKINDIKTEFYEPSELLYHTSWDWLMPVVKEIDDLGYEEYSDVELSNREEGLGLLHIIQDALKDVSIRGVYDAVMDFIKWYNLNNEKL